MLIRSEQARARVLSDFAAPLVKFQIRPRLALDDDNTTPTTRRWGGQIRGGLHYDTVKQELSVRFPYAISPRQSMYRPYGPFAKAQDRSAGYALLTFAEEGKDLGSYDGRNAFGVSVKVEWDKETLWHLAFLGAEDVQRLRPTNFTERSGVPTFRLPLPAEEAQEIASHLVWQIEAKLTTAPEADCIVEIVEYNIRRPTIDNPWHQQQVDVTVPAQLLSVSLLNLKTGHVLWRSP